MAKIEPYLLNLAGEYRVCSELNKRGIFATVTYGNRKGADVYAILDDRKRALKIEVKASQGTKFVTSLSQKGCDIDPNHPEFWTQRAVAKDAPDFWVLCQIVDEGDGVFRERFFVLSHTEICEAQKKRNTAYAEGYLARHGMQPDFSNGVDGVRVEDIEPYEDKWQSIVDRISA